MTHSSELSNGRGCQGNSQICSLRSTSVDSLGTSLVAGIGSGGSLGLSLSSVESRLTLGSSVRTELNA